MSKHTKQACDVTELETYLRSQLPHANAKAALVAKIVKRAKTFKLEKTSRAEAAKISMSVWSFNAAETAKINLVKALEGFDDAEVYEATKAAETVEAADGNIDMWTDIEDLSGLLQVLSDPAIMGDEAVDRDQEMYLVKSWETRPLLKRRMVINDW